MMVVLGGDAQNSGLAFIKLKDWSLREGAEQSAASLARRASGELSTLRDASIFVMQPPAIRGLGDSSGFNLQLKDVGGVGHGVASSAIRCRQPGRLPSTSWFHSRRMR